MSKSKKINVHFPQARPSAALPSPHWTFGLSFSWWSRGALTLEEGCITYVPWRPKTKAHRSENVCTTHVAAASIGCLACMASPYYIRISTTNVEVNPSLSFLKSNNIYVKTKKKGPPQAKIFEIWYFLNPGDYIFIMKIQTPPPFKN